MKSKITIFLILPLELLIIIGVFTFITVKSILPNLTVTIFNSKWSLHEIEHTINRLTDQKLYWRNRLIAAEDCLFFCQHPPQNEYEERLEQDAWDRLEEYAEQHLATYYSGEHRPLERPRYRKGD